MMRWFWIVGFPSLLFSTALVGCGDNAERLQLTADDSTTEVMIDAGEEFEVRLESNPSTGFQWRLAPMVEPGTISLVSTDYEPPDTDLVGAAGTEVFVFEATQAGAEILRLEYIRPSDDPIIPERVAEYIIRVDGVPFTAPDRQPPDTSTATAPDDGDQADDSDQTGDGTAIEVGALFDGEGARDATVSGFVVWDRAGALLCEMLLESMPPQCGGLQVVIANPTSLEDLVEEANGVRWTNLPVDLDGRFDGRRFILDADADTVTETAADTALVEAFLAFAANPGQDTASALPLADEVAIGLGQNIVSNVGADRIADPATWVIDVPDHQGFAGPFSALDVAAEPVIIIVGPHAHCAGPPVPPPDGFDDIRRLSIQPDTATSCIEWWTVDFFIDDGAVVAVTMDLFGP